MGLLSGIIGQYEANHLFFSVFGLIYLISLTTACTKEPKVITNTIIQTDTLYLTQEDTIYINTTDTLIVTDTVSLTKFILDTATTFIVMRHADTDDFGTNPNLNAAGMARVEVLKKLLSDVPLAAVYSTNYNRTMQTAQPIADDHSLSVETYAPFSLNTLADEVLDNHWGETVLVMAHGNTTPDMVNLLIGENIYAELPESAYDNIYMVTVFEQGRGKVLHLKYGE